MITAKRTRTDGQTLRRLGLLLCLLCVSPPLVWWIYNAIDEAPSAEARRFSAIPSEVVADGDNAWLAFVGMDAAADQDPISLGRRRVDEVARVAAVPPWETPTRDDTLFEQAVPMARVDAKLDSTRAFCPERDTSCLDWALEHAATLDRLREANALHLQRYASLQKLAGWRALYPATLDAPVADLSIFRLATQLAALDLARGAAQSDEALRASALSRLAQADAFWRRVMSQPSDLIALMIASAHGETSQRLVGELFDASRPPPTPAMQPAIDAILQPLAEVDWSGAMAHEFRMLEHVMRRTDPGLYGTLRQCMTGTTSDGCLKTLVMNSALAPQATINLHARNTATLLDWLGADPRHIEIQRAKLGEALERTFPAFDHTPTLLRQLSYNFAGRVLASLAIPAMDYGLRVHDREALRRMIVLKRAATQARIDEADMPTFLASQPDALRDPYTGEPFVWDGLFREIHFEPRASRHWKPTRAGIAYSTPPNDVTACPAPFALQVTEHHGDIAEPTVSYLSCGDGAYGYESGESSDPTYLEASQRQSSTRIWRNAEEIGVRVLLRDDLSLHAYEARLLAGENDAITMQPLGHEYAARLTLQRLSAQASMISLNARNRVAAELAREIAATTGIAVQGLERLGNERITLRGDWRVHDALSVIADVNDAWLRETAPGQFSFVPPVASPDVPSR